MMRLSTLGSLTRLGPSHTQPSTLQDSLKGPEKDELVLTKRQVNASDIFSMLSRDHTWELFSINI